MHKPKNTRAQRPFLSDERQSLGSAEDVDFEELLAHLRDHIEENERQAQSAMAIVETDQRRLHDVSLASSGNGKLQRLLVEKNHLRRLAEGGIEQLSGSAPIMQKLENAGFSRIELDQLVAPRRTLDRRVELGQPLAPHEKDRAERLLRVHTLAKHIFGEATKAERWLRKPSRHLAEQSPVTLLQTESGAYEVMELLHAIDHGVYL
jgi:putative toxin-antitoxin system antitoxin component (TIGR02293 family)